MSLSKWEDVASLARQLADRATVFATRSKEKLSRTDVTMQRFKAEVSNRRRMWDAALRKKRGK